MDAFAHLGFSEIQPIHAGYSSDRKYLVSRSGRRFLLKIFSASQLPAKRAEFEAMKKMIELGVSCSEPIQVDSLPGEQEGYLLISYIDGEDGLHALPKMSAKDQYDCGLAAGRELLSIHRYKAPASISPWHERKSAKHQRYVSQYMEGEIKFAGDTKAIAFINRHLHLMADRPNLYQHDDYHLRNLIFRDDRFAGVIDFDRQDWGDPIHEFLKVGQFTSPVSVPFSVGQIRGYLDGNEPGEEFWLLYSLYSAMSLFSFVVWQKHVKPEGMPHALSIIERVVNDHDAFERIMPAWYTR